METKRLAELRARRAQILDAALMCFLENGYHQTGVRDIAERAGVSLGNLYNHFEGKHAVLAEIASLERDALRPFVDMLSDVAPPGDLLDRFVADYGTYLSSLENVVLTVEITSEAIRKPDIARLFLENRDLLLDAMTALLVRGAGEGVFRATRDPRELSKLILDTMDGWAFRQTLGNDGDDHAGLRAFIRHAVCIQEQ